MCVMHLLGLAFQLVGNALRLPNLSQLEEFLCILSLLHYSCGVEDQESANAQAPLLVPSLIFISPNM